jgi:hypothetical protein
MSSNDNRTSSRLGGVGCLLFSLLWTGGAGFLLVAFLWDEFDGPPGPNPDPFAWEGLFYWVFLLPLLFVSLAGVFFSMKALRGRTLPMAANTPPPAKPIRSPHHFLIAFIGLFGLVGLFAALFGTWLAVSAVRFDRDDLKVTEGTVVSIGGTNPRGGRPSMDVPTVRFEADDGPYEVFGRPEPRGHYAIGQQVKVLYPPDNPRLGRMEGQTYENYGPSYETSSAVAATGGGVFLVAVLAIVWILSRRPRLGTPNG